MTAIADIPVLLADGSTSGLASIVQQFLEQQLVDSASRRRRASRLHGRLGLTATDYRASVTVNFRGDQIAVCDGSAEPLDASIAGPYRSLTELLQGRSNPLIEHLRGRLKVKSRLRNPFLPLRVLRLMKLARDGAR
ncbi:SCP2 sterol-binding domain-containing protein [Candidatus Binatus sp.]|uniref:SCP2 sterol-binding domain-containing protein n=1 Tax=Candidatus Binatus sp. TaxID=2811406 RepID=UPI003CB6E81F